MTRLQQLEAALIKADAAGAADDARALAAAIRAERESLAGAPTGPLEGAKPAWQPKRRTVEDLRAQGANITAANDMSGLEQFRTGLAKAGRDFSIGLAQNVVEGGPVGQGVNWLAGKLGADVPRNPLADYLTNVVTEGKQADRQLLDTGAGLAGNIVGNVGIAAIPGAGIGRAGQLTNTGKYALAAASGAGYGAQVPVGEGDSRLQNAATGAAFGAAGQKAGDLLMASGKKAAEALSPQLRTLYEYAKSQGINLTPAQLTDSGFVRRLSLMLDKLPFSGASARQQAQQQAGNKALARLIGQEADTVDRATFDKAATELGEQFDQVFTGGAKYDRQFLIGVAKLRQEADGYMDNEALSTLDKWIERIRSQAGSGNLPPRVLQSLDRQARMAGSGQPGSDKQQMALAFRDLLHDNFERNAPKGLAEQWRRIRQQYATLKTIEPVVSRNTDSGVPLQQLQGAINSTKRGRSARARGRDGELGQLADVGQRIKPPNSSGTAENAQSAAVGLGAIASPFKTLASLAGGAAVSRILNSKGLASLYMARQNPGVLRQALAPYAAAGAFGATPYAPWLYEDSPPER